MSATPEHAARVLGLSQETTVEAVKRVRREMAMKYHPDRCADTERATRHMSRINAAADTLIAHLRRKPRPTPRATQAEAAPKRDTHAPRTAQRAKPEPSPKSESVSAENTAVKVMHVSERDRAAWRAQRRLAEQACASYRTVLSAIGRQAYASQIDMTILRYDRAA